MSKPLKMKKKRQMSLDYHRTVSFYLSGLNSPGLVQKRGSWCKTLTGTTTGVPLGMVTPLIWRFFLHTLSR